MPKAVGRDKGQIGRALAGLVSRKLLAGAVNLGDNREVLLTGSALPPMTRLWPVRRSAIRRLEHLGKEELAMLLERIERLTRTAEQMLAAGSESG